MPSTIYHDECHWNDTGGGLAFEYVQKSGEKLAEVALVDFDARIWKYEVFVPEKFQIDGRTPCGLVYSSAAAKRVAELILLNTIVMKT